MSGQNGWWKDLIGKNKLIDTDRFAVLAFNIPGNCFGKEKNEFLDDLILGDVAKAFNKAISQLGINRVHSYWRICWWRPSLGNGSFKSRVI